MFDPFECPGCGGFKSARLSICPGCFERHGKRVDEWPEWLVWNVRDFDRMRYEEEERAQREIQVGDWELFEELVYCPDGNRHTFGEPVCR